MPTSLLSNNQSRWALHIIVGLLSAVAIASSAPSGAGGMSLSSVIMGCVYLILALIGVEMYSGNAGDLRGLAVILGATGLGGVIILYVDYLLTAPYNPTEPS
jgi:hypothetical protein